MTTGNPGERRWLRHNLPTSTTSCVGREAATEEVLRLLDQPPCRLVTLTGPPGVGKTRLGLAVSELAPARLSCPLYWVSLRDVAGPDALVEALLAVFEAPSEPDAPPLQRLRRHLEPRQLLLVLDNFEHLLPPAVSIDVASHHLMELLAHAPLLRCLVTSRAPLRITGEWTYRVPPLPVPALVDGRGSMVDGSPGADAVGPSTPPVSQIPGLQLFTNESVQLFAERARAAAPAWQLTEENGPAVAALCRHLDGLPLAIELAAAQVRAFSVEELLKPWKEATAGRLAALEDAAAGGVNAWVHSLRLALEVSFARLSPAAQQLLADLAVCAGEFSREAAAAIGGAVSNTVRELVERNWLQKTESEGQSRYGMLETIRAFAEERPGHRRDDAQRRHAEHYLHVAQEAAALWHTARQTEALRTLAREWPNLRRGFHRACQHSEDLWVCAYARAVFPFLTYRAWSRECVGWTEAWLAAAERCGDARERCRALVALGEALRVVEERERSKAMLREGLALAREIDEPQSAGEALWNLSEHILWETHADSAARREALEESLREFRRAGDLPGQARVLSMVPGGASEALQLYRALGSVEGQVGVLCQMARQCGTRGATREGRALLEEALALAEAEGMESEGLLLLGRLGGLSMRLADLDAAARWYDRCVAAARRVGDLYRVARALDWLAGVLLTRGEPEAARPLLDESYRIFLQLSRPRGDGDVLLNMAEYARQTGDLVEAERLLQQSLEVHRARNSTNSIGIVLWLLGQLYRQARRYEAAAQTLEESRRHCGRPEVLLELGAVACEQGNVAGARQCWAEALGELADFWVRRMDLMRALLEIGRMAAASGERSGTLFLSVAARELQAAGGMEAKAAVRDAEAALKRLGQGARAARRQISRTTLEAALDQARSWLEAGSTAASGVSLPAAEARTGPLLRVFVLGRFEVERNGESTPVSTWQRPKVATLFQWLCLQGGRSVSRGEVLEALWGDLPVERAARNLATTLSMLRRALGESGTVTLNTDAETLQLLLGEVVWVDAAAFEQHVAAAARCRRAGDTEGVAGHCRAALDLYRGELLSGEPASMWVLPLRQRFAEQRLQTLVLLAEDTLARGDLAEAVALARQAVQQDACEESAVRVLMQVLDRQGQRTEALRCFQAFRRVLRRELDADPEAATLHLYDRLRQASR